jgi:MFS family permease
MVFVNTVVMVQAEMGLPQTAVAVALAAFGAGSMLAALALPRILERWSDRSVMLTAASFLVVVLVIGSIGPTYAGLISLWFVAGIAYSTAQTPSGRLLRRSANAADRPALFAAQFAWSHACWLVFYPLAGWIGARWGIPVAFSLLGAAAALAIVLAARMWPQDDPEFLEHEHEDGTRHTHAFLIDDSHTRWPQRPR